MIVARAPYRVSFFGGGSDHRGWYEKHGGSVLSAAIKKYCYVSVRWMPEWQDGVKYRVIWRQVEECDDIDKIQHPAVKAVLDWHQFSEDPRGVEVFYQGDLPACSGAGSSSSFAVALLAAVAVLQGQSCPAPHLLATEAVMIERRVLQEPGGEQDQWAAAFGGVRQYYFESHKVGVTPLEPTFWYGGLLEQNCLLVWTGRPRQGAQAAAAIADRFEANPDAMLTRFAAMAEEGVRLLNSQQMGEFGSLLDEAWRLKKGLSPTVSTPEVDEIYAQALAAGAWGGKLLGSGGGGFMVLVAPPEAHDRIREQLRGRIILPLEVSLEGAGVVYSP